MSTDRISPLTLDPLLTDHQLAELENVHVETIRRERRLGRRPPVVQVSPRRHGTRKSVYLRWLEDREHQ